eukprot:2476302-Pyramimonas_sp.AAC.1
MTEDVRFVLSTSAAHDTSSQRTSSYGNSSKSSWSWARQRASNNVLARRGAHRPAASAPSIASPMPSGTRATQAR